MTSHRRQYDVVLPSSACWVCALEGYYGPLEPKKINKSYYSKIFSICFKYKGLVILTFTLIQYRNTTKGCLCNVDCDLIFKVTLVPFTDLFVFDENNATHVYSVYRSYS